MDCAAWCFPFFTTGRALLIHKPPTSRARTLLIHKPATKSGFGLVAQFARRLGFARYWTVHCSGSSFAVGLVSVDFILRFTYAGAATNYACLMKESVGKIGRVALQICIMITNLGCLIMYLIIIGDVLCGNGSEHMGILQEWFGIHGWNSRAFYICLVVIFVMLPLVCYCHK
nr:probable sodium-coupled neutral amino acid transporter 6 [Ipomoea batatas]